MIAIYFKLIASLICCVVLVFAEKSLSAEKTSQTPNGHVVHEIAKLIEAKAISNYGGMLAATTASLHNFKTASIDQSGRTLTNGLDQFITTVAGTGLQGNNLDIINNIAATILKIGNVNRITVDGTGDIYFADSSNNLVRKVTVSTGIITTIAGGGSRGYDQGAIVATDAYLNTPYDVGLDGSGNVYIAEYGYSLIRNLTVITGILTSIAGTGLPGISADGIMATSAQLFFPRGVALDGSGNVYIADTNNNCVRKVTVSTGIITTIAGTGLPGYNSDDIMATTALLNFPCSVALDGSGNVYIADTYNYRIRKVTVSTGIITTIAGTGLYGSGGIVGVVTGYLLSNPTGVAFDGSNNVYIADTDNNCVRKVTVSTGTITTIAGTGLPGYNGDDIIATTALLNHPGGVAVGGTGNVYIADTYNYRIRQISNAPTSSSSTAPSLFSTACPSTEPSVTPTACPSTEPSVTPTACPSTATSVSPTACPSTAPSVTPTACPSTEPSVTPTACPSTAPSVTPTACPSTAPSVTPTACPSTEPSVTPTACPSTEPSVTPTACPSTAPSVTPTACPSTEPSVTPTACPSTEPSVTPTACPSTEPSVTPTACPSTEPSVTPTFLRSVFYRSPFCKELNRSSSAPSTHQCKTLKPTSMRNRRSPSSRAAPRV